MLAAKDVVEEKSIYMMSDNYDDDFDEDFFSDEDEVQ